MDLLEPPIRAQVTSKSVSRRSCLIVSLPFPQFIVHVSTIPHMLLTRPIYFAHNSTYSLLSNWYGKCFMQLADKKSAQMSGRKFTNAFCAD